MNDYLIMKQRNVFFEDEKNSYLLIPNIRKKL